MKPEFITSILAVFVSIGAAISTFLVNKKALKESREKWEMELQANQERVAKELQANNERLEKQLKAESEKQERSFQRRLTEKLYDYRISAYRKGYEITQPLKKITEPNIDIDTSKLLSVLKDLEDWYSSDASFLLTEKSLSAYHELEMALSKIKNSNNRLPTLELQAIADARHQFRISLREDVTLLYSEEN